MNETIKAALFVAGGALFVMGGMMFWDMGRDLARAVVARHRYWSRPDDLH